MNEYIAMWKNCTDFSGKASVRDYWMAILVNAIINTVLNVVLAVYSSYTMYEFDIVILPTLYSLAILLPVTSLTIRRLNDVGKSWTYIFINFIPLFGSIIFLVALCKKSFYGNSGIIYDSNTWMCESCDTRNSNSAMTCKNCGALRNRRASALPAPDVWVCKSCGTGNPNSAMNCKNCGSLNSKRVTAPSDPNVWICKNCGEKNFLGGSFCKTCRNPRS